MDETSHSGPLPFAPTTGLPGLDVVLRGVARGDTVTCGARVDAGSVLEWLGV